MNAPSALPKSAARTSVSVFLNINPGLIFSLKPMTPTSVAVSSCLSIRTEHPGIPAGFTPEKKKSCLTFTAWQLFFRDLNVPLSAFRADYSCS